jgi:hypothetical protein
MIARIAAAAFPLDLSRPLPYVRAPLNRARGRNFRAAFVLSQSRQNTSVSATASERKRRTVFTNFGRKTKPGQDGSRPAPGEQN